LRLITCRVLEREIIATNRAMDVLVVVVSLGTEKEECGEDKLILIPAAVLTM
jgi:hypothetical protein